MIDFTNLGHFWLKGGDSVEWLWDFYDIKDRVLEDDDDTNNTAVVIVNWTKGSEIHFGLFLKDALEGIIDKLSGTADVATPIVSKIITDITSLGELL